MNANIRDAVHGGGTRPCDVMSCARTLSGLNPDVLADVSWRDVLFTFVIDDRDSERSLQGVGYLAIR